MTEHEIRYTAYVGLIPVGHGATPGEYRLRAADRVVIGDSVFLTPANPRLPMAEMGKALKLILDRIETTI